MEGEGDKIKSKQASKQDKTLNVSRDEWMQLYSNTARPRDTRPRGVRT